MAKPNPQKGTWYYVKKSVDGTQLKVPYLLLLDMLPNDAKDHAKLMRTFFEAPVVTMDLKDDGPPVRQHLPASFEAEGTAEHSPGGAQGRFRQGAGSI